MRVRYTDTALAEISELLAYIARENPRAAEKIAGAIRSTIDRLRRHPEGAKRTEDPNVRAAPAGRFPYLIFYTIGSDELIIRNVRHGARQGPA